MKSILKRKNKKGFTLMEMLIVIGIIAILVAIAIPTFSGAQKKAQYAADVANVRAWYAEKIIDNMSNGTALKSMPDADIKKETTIQMTGATVVATLDGTTKEWSVTYTPVEEKGEMKTITFPTPVKE